MPYLKAGDTISGQEAVVRMVVPIDPADPSVTEIQDMFYVRSLNASIEINQTQVRTLGKRGDQNKPSGFTGSGTAVIYAVTSEFRRIGMRYIKQGIPTPVEIIVTNEDPGSTIGRQTVVIKNVLFTTIPVVQVDVDADLLDETIEFTFDDADLLESFTEPVLGIV